MKNLLILSICLLLHLNLIAQDKSVEADHLYTYQNLLKLSPVELGRAEFQIGFERYFNNRKTSLNTLISIISGDNGEEKRGGFQAFLQYRFYLSQLYKETHQTLNMYNIGFYSAPYILGLYQNETYSNWYYDPEKGDTQTELVDEEITAGEGGVLLGVQFDITKRIVLDIFMGGGVRQSKIVRNRDASGIEDYGLLDQGYSGVKPRIGLQMGITF
ncbi:hypothetical protein [Portibacter marinus]|uniref:hypothetical protein n=1 Tax=Portibacter marinus TaxID=2898660 RepID=UPI001F292E88|nr:hypothetical protein [Portibacter marinus]